MSSVTAGLVCGHHHLYSSLARGMPAPPHTPTDFLDILQQIWWRLDVALDLDMLFAAAQLGALDALECGTTALIDHHESPSVIDGSLSVIADACASVGVRVLTAYGVTDRWADDGTLVASNWTQPPPTMTRQARAGLAENERFIRSGGRGMIGVHAAFTCSDETLETAAGFAADLGVGVHVHVAEGSVDLSAGARLEPFARSDWLLAHCVHLDRPLAGTVAHNPRSNMNNGVGYGAPTRFPNPVVLGTDGIGADMAEEFRLAYVRLREHDVTATPTEVWNWLNNGYTFFPDALNDRVTWNYSSADDPWSVAFTPGMRATHVTRADGVELLRDGHAQLIDPTEVRARAAEQAQRLFALL